MWPVTGIEEFKDALTGGDSPGSGRLESVPICCALLYSAEDFNGALANYVNRQFGILNDLTGASLAVFCVTEHAHQTRPLRAADIYEIARALGARVDAISVRDLLSRGHRGKP